jgi:subtilase family serine protease
MKIQVSRFCRPQTLMLAAVVSAFAATAVRTGDPPTAVPQPMFSDALLISASTTPPTEAQCESVGRRCFTPQSVQNSYNLAPLYAAGHQGQGQTIAIVDSYGSDTIAHDLNVYNTQFGLPHMCGEEGVTCVPGMPTFTQLALQGSPATKAPPPKNNGTGLEDKSAWALEVSLDVETAHAIAPRAHILLVTTPTAETLGVQGFPQMMAAEAYVVQHHLATVISQSFGAAEESFGSTQSLLKLRYAFVQAAQNGVTVLAGSGDSGSANVLKTPVGKGFSLIPYPTVGWPASDPLVTGIGGTYLCTDPVTGTGVDSVDPPVICQGFPGVREIGWIGSGGGFSHVFTKPDYQNTLPAGSTPIGTMRGVPDVAFQASSRTGALVYITLPPDGNSGLICGGVPCSTGWYDIGGTSLSTPQWAGLVAIAAEIKGSGLGPINAALYALAAGPNYATYFYDVTTGNNQDVPFIPGYPATGGWDPVTGVGTPNAATLLPALAAY